MKDRKLKIALFAFSNLCEENIATFQHHGVYDPQLGWEYMLMRLLSPKIGSYEGEEISYRVFSYAGDGADMEGVDDDDVPMDIEHDGEYCEACAQKEKEKLQAEEPDTRFCLYGEDISCTENQAFSLCDTCGKHFKYSYYLEEQELEHWNTMEWKLSDDNVETLWEASELLDMECYSDKYEALRYEVYYKLAKAILELCKPI